MYRWSFAMLMVVVWTWSHVGDSEAAGGQAFDFDGNGREDVVAGLPFNGPRESGAVAVLLSRPRGSRWSVLTQRTPGIPGGTQTGDRPQTVRLGGDRFEIRLASGDFDGDGYADLAIGALA